MLEIQRRRILCTGSLDRRRLLSAAALSGAATLLPGTLHSRIAQAAESRSGLPSRRDTAVILFFMAGGPSHIDMYDMKPDAPAEVRGPFGSIETGLPGLRVNELMPRHAAIANQLSVIRSITHGYGVHDDGQHLVQTGHPCLNARQRGQQAPADGAIAARFRGPARADMPAYVCIPEDYQSHAGFYQAAAYLGPQYNALNAGGDPNLGNYRAPEFHLPSGVTSERVVGRKDLLRQVDALAREADAGRLGAASVDRLADFQRSAIELVTGSAAREAFDLSREPEAVRERYGRHAYGQSALMARRLVEAGVTFVTINLYEKDVDWWDDHYTIEKNLRKRLPLYDQALCTLIEELHERGLNERVLVAAYGEFGRAPRVDQYTGRGHWPGAMSAVLCGGGGRGGQIIGSTDKDGGYPKDRPLKPGDLLSSVLHVLGIDSEQKVLDHAQRPVPLVADGAPIAELFGSPS